MERPQRHTMAPAKLSPPTPLAANSATICSISARPRHRPTMPPGLSFIPTLQHGHRALDRWGCSYSYARASRSARSAVVRHDSRPPTVPGCGEFGWSMLMISDNYGKSERLFAIQVGPRRWHSATRRGRRRMSPAAREWIAAAQKKRWAAVKAAKKA
jgi:hypothetical protein